MDKRANWQTVLTMELTLLEHAPTLKMLVCDVKHVSNGI